MGRTVSKQQESGTLEVSKDETQLPAHRQLHSGPIHRLGPSEKSDAGKCNDELQLDNSLQLRAMSSSALLTTSANLLEDESPGEPSFRYYLEKDSKLDLNKESQRNEKQVWMPQTDGKLKKLHQLIDTSKTLIPYQEPQSKANKKKKKYKFKFLTRKNKDFEDKASLQHQILVITPRLSQEHVAAMTLQKMIRGFLLRKDLRILRIIDTTVEEFDKTLVKYEEILKSGKKVEFTNDDNITIMNLQCQLNSVRGEMVYKRKVREKIVSLQDRVNTIDAEACKRDLDTMITKSTIVVDPDELRVESFKFSKMQHHKMVRTRSSMGQALSDNTSTKMQDNNNIMKNDVKGLDSENQLNSMIEANQTIEASNVMKESKVDEQETKGAGGDTTMKHVDPIDGENESSVMVELNGLTKQPLNFDQNDEISSTERSPVKYTGMTKKTEIKQLVETKNSDKKITEQEVNSNDPAMETMNEVYDPIKYQKLLNNFQKWKQQKEFSDHAIELSQLETYDDKTEEKEIKGFKEIMDGLKELSIKSKEMKTLMKGLENRVQDLGKSVLRIDSREKINMRNFKRRRNSFS